LAHAAANTVIAAGLAGLACQTHSARYSRQVAKVYQSCQRIPVREITAYPSVAQRALLRFTDKPAEVDWWD